MLLTLMTLTLITLTLITLTLDFCRPSWHLMTWPDLDLAYIDDTNDLGPLDLDDLDLDYLVGTYDLDLHDLDNLPCIFYLCKPFLTLNLMTLMTLTGWPWLWLIWPWWPGLWRLWVHWWPLSHWCHFYPDYLDELDDFNGPEYANVFGWVLTWAELILAVTPTDTPRLMPLQTKKYRAISAPV